MILWDGSCIVHEAFSMERIAKQLADHPNAKLIAHPESETPVLELAHFIGSTSALLNYVEQDDCQSLSLQQEDSSRDEKTCTTQIFDSGFGFRRELQLLRMFLYEEKHAGKTLSVYEVRTSEITMDEEIRLKALKPIEAMLNFPKASNKITNLVFSDEVFL
jgi:quinolinate synthase